MNRQTRPSELTGTPVGHDADVYLIECDHIRDGRRTRYMPERDTACTNRADTIRDILEGQEENVRRVVRFNTATFSSEDVSEEIASEVMSSVLEHSSRVPDHVADFLEEHLGIATVIAAERELVS